MAKNTINGLQVFHKIDRRKDGFHRVDYEFQDIIEPIADILGHYYWMLEDVTFCLRDGVNFLDSAERQNLILDSNDEFTLGDKCFINLCAKYIDSDWCNIYGCSDYSMVENLNCFRQKAYQTPSKLEVYFTNIDAAYWEVYSRNKQILDKIKAIFQVVKHVDKDLNSEFKPYEK